MAPKVITYVGAVMAALMLICGGCTQTKEAAQVTPLGGMETYARGVYAYQSGSPDAAETLKQAIEQNPELIMARILLGKIYKEKGEYAAASQYYQRLTQLDPYEVSHWYNLGVSYQMIKRLQEAAASYQSAIRLSPEDFGSTMNLGLVYLALGDVNKAVNYTQKAATLRPDSAEAQANLAVTLDAAGKYTQAEDAYRRSLEIAPSQTGTLVNYANNLLAQKKWQESIEVLNAALKKENTPYLHKRLGDAYAMGKQYDNAETEYQTALKLNPKYYTALNEKGRLLMLRYQEGMELNETLRDQALGMWRQSMEINPNQPALRATLEDWEKRLFSKDK